MFDIPGAIKGVSGVVGKLFVDKTEKMMQESALREVAMTHAQAGNMEEFKLIQEAMLTHAKSMERAPWIIRTINGLVRPFGGLGALATVFWVIWAPYWGYPQLQLPDIAWNNPIWAIIAGIITFFFGLRHAAQVKGVKDK